MRCEPNIEKSLVEVIRVTKHEAAVMAILDGKLVGTMGIIKPTWWYGDADFLTDRWHSVLPQFWHGPVNEALMDEAINIAKAADLEFIHNGKLRAAKRMHLRFPRAYNAKDSPEEGGQ